MKPKEHLLIIEDDRTLNQLLCLELRRLGYAVTGAETRAEAESHLNRQGWNLILTDARLPRACHGFSAGPCQRTPGHRPDRLRYRPGGCFGDQGRRLRLSVTKPINLDELELEVKRALGQDAMRRDHQYCRERLRQPGSMAGNSQALNEVHRLIDAVWPPTPPC